MSDFAYLMDNAPASAVQLQIKSVHAPFRIPASQVKLAGNPNILSFKLALQTNMVNIKDLSLNLKRQCKSDYVGCLYNPLL